MNNNEAWEYALGMIQVDGLTPSKKFLELVEQEKQGKITTKDIVKYLNEIYSKDVEKVITEVVSIQAMEGITVTEETKQIIRDCIAGEKTFEQARQGSIKEFQQKYKKE